MDEENDLLEVVDLTKYYPVYRGVIRIPRGHVYAVDGVNFRVRKGESLGLVGESGCGKTTVARCIVQLETPTSGEIKFMGRNILKASGCKHKEGRKNIQIIFQDPYSSLNPRMKIGKLIEEPLLLQGIKRNDRQEIVRESLDVVGLDEKVSHCYAHEMSGGQRQRICIARALALKPKLVICDEPTSALDVSIQSQILNLLIKLQNEFGLTYLFVSHDLSVIRHVSDTIAVMYLGNIVEIGDTDEVFDRPLHPYTRALLSSIPLPEPARHKKRPVLSGSVPSALTPPPGCRFHTRCPSALDSCRQDVPLLREVSPGRKVACHLIN